MTTIYGLYFSHHYTYIVGSQGIDSSGSSTGLVTVGPTKIEWYQKNPASGSKCHLVQKDPMGFGSEWIWIERQRTKRSSTELNSYKLYITLLKPRPKTNIVSKVEKLTINL